jgi:hypothetical protein
VGSARDDEDSHEGHRHVPKLILAGRLTGTLDGRPVVIEAGESGLLLSMSAFQTAWAARGTLGPVLPLLQALKTLNVPLRLRIAGIMSLELLPNPSAVAKLFSPVLSRLG